MTTISFLPYLRRWWYKVQLKTDPAEEDNLISLTRQAIRRQTQSRVGSINFLRSQVLNTDLQGGCKNDSYYLNCHFLSTYTILKFCWPPTRSLNENAMEFNTEWVTKQKILFPFFEYLHWMSYTLITHLSSLQPCSWLVNFMRQQM